MRGVITQWNGTYGAIEAADSKRKYFLREDFIAEGLARVGARSHDSLLPRTRLVNVGKETRRRDAWSIEKQVSQ